MGWGRGLRWTGGAPAQAPPPPHCEPGLGHPGPHPGACHPLEVSGTLWRVSDRFSRCGVHSRGCCGIWGPRCPGVSFGRGAGERTSRGRLQHLTAAAAAGGGPWGLQLRPGSARLARTPPPCTRWTWRLNRSAPARGSGDPGGTMGPSRGSRLGG